jgi:hypothetical protein
LLRLQARSCLASTSIGRAFPPLRNPGAKRRCDPQVPQGVLFPRCNPRADCAQVVCAFRIASGWKGDPNMCVLQVSSVRGPTGCWMSCSIGSTIVARMAARSGGPGGEFRGWARASVDNRFEYCRQPANAYG